MQEVNGMPLKRIAVCNAHNKIHDLCTEFKVPLVQKTFGTIMVRVLCRTIPQLDNIGTILEELMRDGFIMEIGMPLVYAYKMKSLVIFIKPKPNNKERANSIEKVIQKCKVDYSTFILVSDNPSAPTEIKLNEKMNKTIQETEKDTTIPENETNDMCIWESVQEQKREIEQLYTVVFIVTIGNLFLSLYIFFDL
jgi:hypothetical protein